MTHRDLKVSNLLLLDGSWRVSDFGLARFPDSGALTRINAFVGANHYIAPELFIEAGSSPGPVDVFALAKTLWTVATGLPAPVPGRRDHRFTATRISSYGHDESESRALEVLLAASTDANALNRPTMREFADELSAWLLPSARLVGPPADNALVRRARVLLDPHTEAVLAQVSKTNRLQKFAQEADEMLREHVGSRLAKYGLLAGDAIQKLEKVLPIPASWRKDNGVFVAAAAIAGMTPQLRDGTYLYANLMLDIRLAAERDKTRMTAVAHIRDNKGYVETVWFESEEMRTDSTIEARTRDRFLALLVDAVPQVVTRLLDRLDSLDL